MSERRRVRGWAVQLVHCLAETRCSEDAFAVAFNMVALVNALPNRIQDTCTSKATQPPPSAT